MDLNLTDTMPVGKHRGKRIEEVLKEDVGYLIWMRNEKERSGDKGFFSREVLQLLNTEISKSGHLQRRGYKQWDLTESQAPAVSPAQQAKEVARAEVSYGGWGAF